MVDTTSEELMAYPKAAISKLFRSELYIFSSNDRRELQGWEPGHVERLRYSIRIRMCLC